MSTRTLTDDYIVVDDPERGRILYVLPAIPDDAPYRIREGIARRRVATITGECPCGGKRDGLPIGERGRVTVTEFPHQPRCPAITSALTKELRRWAR